MSYFRKQRALSGVSTSFPAYRRPRVPYGALGSLGDDTTGATTITTPTLPAPTADPATLQWQANVLGQLQAGVSEMKRGDFYKLLQIAATLSIPLATVVWKWIFKRGAADIGTGV